MAKGIKIRATAKGGSTTVKALMSHPMETGQRKNKKTGKKIPAHFIQEVTCEHNGNSVLTALWGPAVSKNPYLSFKFTGGAKGDSIKISWVDNKGESASQEAKIR
ncbi:MAG: thiosulfate oxidation carrier complex protein SoxZ [Granulosicoccaceae bacterium]|jgi:sulfur-oxidizing protein SoxZ